MARRRFVYFAAVRASVRTPVQAHVHHCLVNVKFDGYPRAAVFVNRRNIDVFLNETLKPVVYHYTVGASVPLYPGTGDFDERTRSAQGASAQGAQRDRSGSEPTTSSTFRSSPDDSYDRHPISPYRRSPKTTLSDSSETSWKISFTVQRSLRARNSLFHRFSFSYSPFSTTRSTTSKRTCENAGTIMSRKDFHTQTRTDIAYRRMTNERSCDEERALCRL